MQVAPYTGAWIEIRENSSLSVAVCVSLPIRERGLKSRYSLNAVRITKVAPYTGAWIEIMRIPCVQNVSFVAPYTGAWIEIFFFLDIKKSLIVAPYTGAWIETNLVICGQLL